MVDSEEEALSEDDSDDEEEEDDDNEDEDDDDDSDEASDAEPQLTRLVLDSARKADAAPSSPHRPPITPRFGFPPNVPAEKSQDIKKVTGIVVEGGQRKRKLEVDVTMDVKRKPLSTIDTDTTK